MAEIIWSEKALNDLREIESYIGKDSERYALRVVIKIIERTSILNSFPLSGRMVPELESFNYRELIEGNYRIIYRIVNDKIEILTVRHSARLL